MVVVKYKCPICRTLFDTEQEAKACELQGVPIFKLKVGDLILHYTVVKQRVFRNRKGEHVPGYLKSYKGDSKGYYYEDGRVPESSS